MANSRAPRAPKDLATGGKRLWNRVQRDFELADHEESVLLQACRIVDLLDRLQAAMASEDVVVDSPQGKKTNPAVVEFRQQALALAKCMASLRIPFGDDETQPQQRSGARRASLSTAR